MKAKNTNNTAQSKSIVRIAIVVGLILLIPLVLTIHDGRVEGVGWNWTLSDFIIMGALLFITGLAIDFAARKITNPFYKVIAVIAIAAALFLIWAELAVDGASQALELLLH